MQLVSLTNQYGDLSVIVTATDDSASAARDTFYVHVSQAVNPPPSPRNLTLSLSGAEDVRLNWTMSDTTLGSQSIQRYLVFYRSNYTYPWQFLWATQDRNTLTYLHQTVARFSPAMFYSVRSWSGDSDGFDREIRNIMTSRELVNEEDVLQRLHTWGTISSASSEIFTPVK